MYALNCLLDRVPTSYPFLASVLSTPPLEPFTRIRSDNWIVASQREHDFRRPVNRNGLTLSTKLFLLQNFHWKALARAVEARCRRDSNGRIVANGWTRNDMCGMIDWYRDCFQLPAWWWPTRTETERRLVDKMHNDGVWLTVLLTSPWWDCSELRNIVDGDLEMRRGRWRRLMVGRRGLPVYGTMEHESDAKQQEFLDAWVRIANEVPLRRGDVLLPGIVREIGDEGRSENGEGSIWQYT